MKTAAHQIFVIIIFSLFTPLKALSDTKTRIISCSFEDKTIQNGVRKAKVNPKGLSRPPYPSKDLALRNTGQTKLILHLGVDGKVKHIDIKESNASKSLDKALTDWAYKNWVFIPCLDLNSKAVSCQHEITYTWRLEGK